MRDDTVTTSWKRLTDKVKTPYGECVRGGWAKPLGTTLHLKPHGESLGLDSDTDAAIAGWEDEGGPPLSVE